MCIERGEALGAGRQLTLEGVHQLAAQALERSAQLRRIRSVRIETLRQIVDFSRGQCVTRGDGACQPLAKGNQREAIAFDTLPRVDQTQGAAIKPLPRGIDAALKTALQHDAQVR